MVAILKRTYQPESQAELEDSNDFLTDADLARLSLLDIPTEDLLDELSDDERKMFEAAVTSGEVQTLLEPWTPWWKDRRCLILDLNSEESQFPQVLQGVPALSQLTKSQPSPYLMSHLVEVLYCYVLVMRRYNGDTESESHEVVNLLLDVSDVFHGKVGASSPRSNVNAAIQRAVQKSCSRQLAVCVVSDVVCILELQQRGVELALSHIHQLFSKALADAPGFATKSVKSLCLKASKKIEFFFAWAQTQTNWEWKVVTEQMKQFLTEIISSVSPDSEPDTLTRLKMPQ
eukprot:c6366_g1_i4.p1 GENE.c6366_g1_i4~~c6366_g1_i4.p1  ORF type:complete len:288 (+),score=43.88 c6366_g1_i4:167-1030(+)